MTNEEAISAIETAKAECEWNAPLDYQIAFDMAIRALRKQKPQGHWIDTGATGPDKFKVYKCSRCGTKVFMGYPEYSNMREYRGFCSHCGADMSGGDLE